MPAPRGRPPSRPSLRRPDELGASAERIVDAAEGLIQTVGYNGFSYEDVARIVGIRKPSIHHHFPSKSDLGAVVARRYTQRFRDALARLDGAVPARLMAYAGLFEATYDADRRLCICGMLGAEADSLPDEINVQVGHFFQANLEWLTATFAAGLADGSLRSARGAGELAEAYLCALEGALTLARAWPHARGPQHTAEVLLAPLTG